jgi:hypothetical protein
MNQLAKQYESLKEQRIRVEQDLKRLEEELTRMQAEAVEAFGTADVAQLEKLLGEQQAENERLCRDYQNHLQQLQAELATIEKQEAR